MFVCICNAVADGVITDSIHRGASTVAQVGRSCAAGTGCGTCRVRIRQMLEQHRAAEGSPHGCAQIRRNQVEGQHRPSPPRISARSTRLDTISQDRRAHTAS